MSLFAHLALQFGTHPENLASEGLGYVLAKSAAARRSLVALAGAAPQLPAADLRFITQVASEDQGRPDLAGLDDEGKIRMLIEVKFWAGFTDQQPLGYLQLLPANGVLLLVAPRVRLPYVRRELARRILASGQASDEPGTLPDELAVLRLGERRLVVVSWSHLLSTLRVAVSDDAAVVADIAQLDGLCVRMDTEAFIPVTSAELTSSVIRRYHEFSDILDEVVAQLVSEGNVNTSGLRASAGKGWYGRFARLFGVPVILQVSTYKWTSFEPTPLWITIYGREWQNSDPGPAKREIASRESLFPSNVYYDRNGFPTMPLQVPTGEERHDVIAAVARQLRVIGGVLASAAAILGDRPVPPAAPPTVVSV